MPDLPFSVTGEDEEAGAAGYPGGDCAVQSVLHPAAGETHLPQLGQRNSPPGSHLSHIQGAKVSLQYICFLKPFHFLLRNIYLLFFCGTYFVVFRAGCAVSVVTLMGM